MFKILKEICAHHSKMNQGEAHNEAENLPAAIIPVNPENEHFNNLGARIRNVGQRQVILNIFYFKI